ncbi:hypothetical protein D3C76_1781110 [compost metagenome]
MAQHHGAGVGQAQVRAAAFQQLHAEALLQLGHLLADGGLGGVQGLAGLGEATLADHFDEAA